MGRPDRTRQTSRRPNRLAYAETPFLAPSPSPSTLPDPAPTDTTAPAPPLPDPPLADHDEHDADDRDDVDDAFSAESQRRLGGRFILRALPGFQRCNRATKGEHERERERERERV
jgi:hypothetical protein